MSWAFVLDFKLTVPAATWPALAEASPASHPIAPDWWGFASSELAATFSPDYCDTMTAASALRAFEEMGQRVFRIDAGADAVAIRVCVALEQRGEPYLAKPLAALLEAARAAGGTGKLALVSDGRYPGEGGAIVTLAGGALARERIADPQPLAAQLYNELFAAEPFEDDLAPEPPPKKPRAKKPKKS